jgi:hypothetical protein
LKEFDNIFCKKDLDVASEIQYIHGVYSKMDQLFSTAHQETSEGKTTQYEETENGSNRPIQQCLPLNLNLANIASDFEDQLKMIETLKYADPVYCTKQFITAMREVSDSVDQGTTYDVVSVKSSEVQNLKKIPSFLSFFEKVLRVYVLISRDEEDKSQKEKLKEICHKYTEPGANRKTSVLDALESALRSPITDKGRRILGDCILKRNGKSFLNRSSWEGKLN